MAVRALSFDVFGTLVDWRSGVAEGFRAVGVADDPDELAEAWRARYRPILAEVNAGSRPWGNFDELHEITLDDLLGERGIELPADARRELVRAWHLVLAGRPRGPGGAAAQPSDRGFVQRARSPLVDLARHGDLRFDCILSAELVRAYKPAPVVYQSAAGLLGVEPADLMMVAAHPWDLDGARGAGLRTALVERPLEHGPGSAGYEYAAADESVASLIELAARLEG